MHAHTQPLHTCPLLNPDPCCYQETVFQTIKIYAGPSGPFEQISLLAVHRVPVSKALLTPGQCAHTHIYHVITLFGLSL